MSAHNRNVDWQDEDINCTSEEIFDSFMEIVNDPKLHSHDENNHNVNNETVDGELIAKISQNTESETDSGCDKDIPTESNVDSDLKEKSEVDFSKIIDKSNEDLGFADMKNESSLSNKENYVEEDSKLVDVHISQVNQDSGIQQPPELPEKMQTTDSVLSHDEEKNFVHSQNEETSKSDIMPSEFAIQNDDTGLANKMPSSSIDIGTSNRTDHNQETDVETKGKDMITQKENIEQINSIEEGIRMTSKVCDELKELTKRLSHSSDDMLAGNESGDVTQDTIVKSNESDMTSDLIKVSSESDENNHSGTSPLSHGTSEEKNKKQNSSPNLISTTQDNVSSPIQLQTKNFDNDFVEVTYTSSMTDSQYSSESSLSGDTNEDSNAVSQRPISWDVLNTVFEDTDDDDGAVYESKKTFGGFGIFLEKEHDNDELHTQEPLVPQIDDNSHTKSQSHNSIDCKKQPCNSKPVKDSKDAVICSGFMEKLGGTGILPKNWRKRWCVLRNDRCLYYYKGQEEKSLCGIIVLVNYIINNSAECHRKNCIKISKGGGRTYFFSANTSTDMLRWVEALRKAANCKDGEMNFFIHQEIIHNVAIPALSIKNPDCHGHLTKQGGRSTRSWKRRYCVLKNGCLYYYREMADSTALGVAKLHKYTINQEFDRRNGFQCIPPHSSMRTFTFIADNDYDKQRWVSCFIQSIQAFADNSTS